MSVRRVLWSGYGRRIRLFFVVNMNVLKRIFVWIKRVRYVRGFGIQSPWAYRMVRYVINEHYPYYSYAELRDLYPNIGDTIRHRAELYLRLANAFQPSLIVNGIDADSVYDAYFHAGCLKSEIVSVNTYKELFQFKTLEMVRVSLEAFEDKDFLDQILDVVSEKTVLILEHISKNRRLWKSVIADNRIQVSFDLYDIGLLFFDKKVQIGRYIVNF